MHEKANKYYTCFIEHDILFLSIDIEMQRCMCFLDTATYSEFGFGESRFIWIRNIHKNIYIITLKIILILRRNCNFGEDAQRLFKIIS